MQLEVGPRSCPLCKCRLPESSDREAPGTRLCRECQAMVLTAFRGSVPISSSMAIAGEDQTITSYHNEAVVEDYSLAGAAEYSEDISPVFSSSGSETDISEFPSFETNEDPSFRFFENEDSVYQGHSVATHLHSDSNNGDSNSSINPAELFPPFNEISAVAESDPSVETPKAVQHYATQELQENAELKPNSLRTESDYQEAEEREGSSVGTVTADPWEDPLPAWDYSQNEWPVLVGTGKRGVQKLPRAVVLAFIILLVALLSYFLVYRPANAKRGTSDSGALAGGKDAHSAAAAEEQIPASSSSVNPSTPVSTPSEPATASTAANENNNAQGKFSLQAAAFSTESGANDFAEKLKHSGVPSYVVPADVARRGRWYRVRVGRFNSADEAQRFASEVQLRAKTTGLALQLIVCQYEQP
jgi:cell division septation protein DedD